LLTLAILAGHSVWHGRALPPPATAFSRRETVAAVRAAAWELPLPIALGYGIDPLHRGIILLANMHIGYLTSPVGMNLFIT